MAAWREAWREIKAFKQRHGYSEALAMRGIVRVLLLSSDPQFASVSALSYAQLTYSNLQMMLRCADRSSMAHSVESRVPFLDHRVVEFALGLPDDVQDRRRRDQARAARRHERRAARSHPRSHRQDRIRDAGVVVDDRRPATLVPRAIGAGRRDQQSPGSGFKPDSPRRDGGRHAAVRSRTVARYLARAMDASVRGRRTDSSPIDASMTMAGSTGRR